VIGGRAGPLEKTVRTTREPEGRIQRVNAIVILGFDAGAAELKRAGQLARQALGLQASRGDSLNVYALPAVVAMQPEAASVPSAPVSIPQVAPRPAPPAHEETFPAYSPGWLAAGAGVLLLGVVGWWRARRAPSPELPADDFDAELDAARNQALADPRVTADVIKLWMRA
jgi:flagellar M-ring protein FliF